MYDSTNAYYTQSTQVGTNLTIRNANNSGTTTFQNFDGNGISNDLTISAIDLLITKNTYIRQGKVLVIQDTIITQTNISQVNGILYIINLADPNAGANYGSINIQCRNLSQIPTTILSINLTNTTITNNLSVSGQITAASFNATSDYRIKSNIRSLDDSTNVDKLKPVIYYNTQLKKEDIGFIAHELQEEFPFLVNGEKDGKEYQNINYNGIIGILVKEVQELKKQVKELQEKVHKLENP
jgi:hypothetical protein